ncbi:MAG: hypothetical protein K0S46_36 [Moraxellaceae bacterium]|jgi:hypothetical protein|nr:hypothetical protein [Moraxellaceae bacterium]
MDLRKLDELLDRVFAYGPSKKQKAQQKQAQKQPAPKGADGGGAKRDPKGVTNQSD